MYGWEVRGYSNVVRGFTISGSYSAGFDVRGNNNLIEGNEIFHMGQDGIWFFGSNNVYRDNYIHDILRVGYSGDPHADCFQTWAQDREVTNTLIENNVCVHNREWGSNQIFMVESRDGYIDNLTIQGNTFYMYDTGETLLNINRKDGQYPITNVYIYDNYFANVTGTGLAAIRMVSVNGGEIAYNVVVGYDQVFRNNGSTGILVHDNEVQ